jgi:hypothetical protein
MTEAKSVLGRSSRLNNTIEWLSHSEQTNGAITLSVCLRR